MTAKCLCRERGCFVPHDECTCGCPNAINPDTLRAEVLRMRFDPKHHLGGGDIRLTIGQQEEIADAWERDRLAGHEWRIEGEELRQRLEAAEKALEQEHADHTDTLTQLEAAEAEVRDWEQNWMMKAYARFEKEVYAERGRKAARTRAKNAALAAGQGKP